MDGANPEGQPALDQDRPPLATSGLAGESGRKTAPLAREGHPDPVPLPTGFADGPSLFPPVRLAPALEMTSAPLGALGD